MLSNEFAWTILFPIHAFVVGFIAFESVDVDRYVAHGLLCRRVKNIVYGTLYDRSGAHLPCAVLC